MDKKLRGSNISIAKYLGYTYIPWNTTLNVEPGWQIYEVYESLRPYVYLCRHHYDLNFHRDIKRSELILSTIKDYGYGYIIDNSLRHGLITVTFNKPNKEPITVTGINITEAVYEGVLTIIKHHNK